jgi:formate hydrogenlyase subunit 3/multisubunit Na+/H+ antiporter MnhD subunit
VFGGLSITFGVYFKPPFLTVDVKRLAIFQVVKLMGLVIEFIGVVDVLGIYLIAECEEKYSVVNDFLLKLKNPPSL